MNRVKFVLKNILFKPNVLRETRKINKEKYNKNIFNHTKIIKRQYHTTKSNNGPDKNDNKMLILASIIFGQFYYIHKDSN
jgi:hypothetical protein